MLNKKKVIIVVAIVIILALIIGFFVLNSREKDKLAKIYNKLSESEEYLFEMNDTNNYEITIAKKGNQTCIDMNSDDDRVTTLVKDNVSYVISHSQKEYRVYNSNLADETVITDMLGNLKEIEHTTGNENVNGKNYKYEEYEGFSGFMTSTNMEIDESKTKTRFYFEGDNLAYIKTILDKGEEELLETKISYIAPDELFEIPSDYAEHKETEF